MSPVCGDYFYNFIISICVSTCTEPQKKKSGGFYAETLTLIEIFIW